MFVSGTRITFEIDISPTSVLESIISPSSLGIFQWTMTSRSHDLGIIGLFIVAKVLVLQYLLSGSLQKMFADPGLGYLIANNLANSFI